MSVPNTVLKLKGRTVKGKVVRDDVDRLLVARGKKKTAVILKSEIVEIRHPKGTPWTREGTSAMARWLRWKDEAMRPSMTESIRLRMEAGAAVPRPASVPMDSAMPFLKGIAERTASFEMSESGLAECVVLARRALEALASEGVSVGPRVPAPVDEALLRAAEVHLA